MKATRSLLVTGLLVGAVVGIGVTMSARREGSSLAEAPPPMATVVQAPALSGTDPQAALAPRYTALPVSMPNGSVPVVGGLPDFSTLAEALAPSVVNISTESEENEADAERRMMQNPFESFQGPRRSLGSGFVFDQEGYIITNAHVVQDATKIVVRLHDERELEAKVIGSDAKTDIAVIRIEGAEDLVPVSLGDSGSLKVGEWVLAIGNPFGLDHTLTAGIVSAKGRRISRRNPYDDFIQTDAAINPGNSGGPLVNLAGQVIGINSAIFSSGGGNIGIGFAIPINMAREIVPQLKEDGHVTRGWLGVKIQPVDADIARSLGLEESKGALVAEVFKDSPAAAAGVQIGDVIVGFDGNDVVKSADLPALVASTPVGKTAKLVVIRGGDRLTVDVEVAKLAEDAESVRPVRAAALGLTVQDLTPDVAQELGIEKDAGGVVVTSVTKGSAAAAAGMEPGDLVVSVANEPITSAERFREMLEKATPERGLLVLVRRGDQTLFRVLKPLAKKMESREGQDGKEDNEGEGPESPR
ncbi:MAG: DegQ family serine endoprotease [Candidatus Binatia bacterium]